MSAFEREIMKKSVAKWGELLRSKQYVRMCGPEMIEGSVWKCPACGHWNEDTQVGAIECHSCGEAVIVE